MSPAAAKPTRRMTTVALIPRAAIVSKHGRNRFSPTTRLEEKSMAVAKRLSYVRSRSRMERPRRIDGPSFAHRHCGNDEAPRPPHAPSSARSASAAAPVVSRPIFTTAAQLAGVASEALFAIAARLLSEILAGCAAYALAMHGLPAAAFDQEAGDARPSASPDPPTKPSRPTLPMILAGTERDIGADESFSLADNRSGAVARLAARSEQTVGARSSWRMAIIAPAVLRLSKNREQSARRRAIAELRNLERQVAKRHRHRAD